MKMSCNNVTLLCNYKNVVYCMCIYVITINVSCSCVHVTLWRSWALEMKQFNNTVFLIEVNFPNELSVNCCVCVNVVENLNFTWTEVAVLTHLVTLITWKFNCLYHCGHLTCSSRTNTGVSNNIYNGCSFPASRDSVTVSQHSTTTGHWNWNTMCCFDTQITRSRATVSINCLFLNRNEIWLILDQLEHNTQHWEQDSQSIHTNFIILSFTFTTLNVPWCQFFAWIINISSNR